MAHSFVLLYTCPTSWVISGIFYGLSHYLYADGSKRYIFRSEKPPPPALQTPIPKCIVTILEDELKLSILKTKFALLLSTPALLLCRSVASIRCPVTPARSLKSNLPSTIFHIPDSINWAISPHM